MITTGGPVLFSAINTELGYSSTASGTITARLAEMGETTDPDSFSEARGYDHDPHHSWWQCTGAFQSSCGTGNATYQIYVKNNSTDHTYSGTLYWGVNDSSVSPGSWKDSGSGSLTKIGAGSSTTIYAYPSGTGVDCDNFLWISFDNTNWERIFYYT